MQSLRAPERPVSHYRNGRLRGEADGQPAGTVWEATLIQAGVSLNRVFYPDSLLREAAIPPTPRKK